MLILSAVPADWPDIRRIYLAGIRTGRATFTTEADIPDAPGWFASKLPGFVCKAVAEDGSMLGWAALSSTSKRRVYAGVVEVTVYVAPEATGQGVGTALLRHLIEASEQAGLWTLQAVIFPENTASLRLHERLGFRVVGRRRKVGKLGGVWRDTVLLERRSGVVW